MGTWGVGLYESDSALDGRDTFHDALRKRLSVDAALDYVFRELGCKREEEPELLLVLANELLQMGITSHPLFSEAREVILSGAEIEQNWRDNASDEDTRKRELVLQRLLTRLPPDAGPDGPSRNGSPSPPRVPSRPWWRFGR